MQLEAVPSAEVRGIDLHGPVRGCGNPTARVVARLSNFSLDWERFPVENPERLAVLGVASRPPVRACPKAPIKVPADPRTANAANYFLRAHFCVESGNGRASFWRTSWPRDLRSNHAGTRCVGPRLAAFANWRTIREALVAQYTGVAVVMPREGRRPRLDIARLPNVSAAELAPESVRGIGLPQLCALDSASALGARASRALVARSGRYRYSNEHEREP